MCRTLAMTILALCCATQVVAQAGAGPRSHFLLFGGQSANIDYVPDRGTLVITDRKVSPFFSHGSGPIGFELSITRLKRRHLAFTADLSGYFDRFTGAATYCQPTGCGTGLRFETKTQTFYLLAGPELRGSEWGRVTPFVHSLIGAVYSNSKYTMAGSNVQYFNPYMGTGLIVASSSAFPKDSTVHYADSNTDAGLTLTLGGGLDVRMSEAVSGRVLMDYAPTFLARPDLRNTALAQSVGMTHIQKHARLSFGIVWHFH